MKTASPMSPSQPSFLPRRARVLLCALLMGFAPQARAERVDAELVLLVDISRSGSNQTQFSTLMSAYASSFTSAEVLNSIQSGQYGRIAVSLQFYGGASLQRVGIPWMSIGNATEAANFAALTQSVVRPVSSGASAVAPALAAATRSFGTETGGASNGFESNLQIIDVVATTVPNNRTTAAVRAAGDAAIASGVDVINAIALGGRATSIANYFRANVVDSTVDGIAPTVASSLINRTLAPTLTSAMVTTMEAPLAAIPEPGVGLGLIVTTCLVVLRRRRN
jgi:hypothetical protein